MVAEEHDDGVRSGGIDPRYDPAFQRGYQPRPGERAQTRVRSDSPDSAYRRPSSLLPVDEGGAEGDADDAVEPPAASERPLPAAGLDLPPEPATVPLATGPRLLGRLETDPRRNPFMLALWLVGAGFVVLGIILYCVSVTASYNGPTPSTDVTSLVFAQLGWMLAGPLITVGLVTIVGLLFLTAVTARRPAPAQPAPSPDRVD